MASHINCKNVFGGLGGITLEPNVFLLSSKSAGFPDKPEIFK